MNIHCFRRSQASWLAITVGFCLAVTFNGFVAAESGRPVQGRDLSAGNIDGFLIVDCLLPGQVRRLGTALTFLTPRRAMKLNADECAIRGGEYVAYDRADLTTALSVWLPQAQAGDAQAQTYVGELLERGIGGLAPRYREAAEWYAKAAAQGNARARINLGFLYEKGLGVEKDQVAALNFYRQASGVEGVIALEGGTPDADSGQEEALRVLREELDETRRELEKARQELQRRQGAERSEIDRLEREREQARTQGDTVAERKLAAELRQREQELDAVQRTVAHLERTVADYRARLEGADSERSALAGQLAEAQRSLAESNTELAARRAMAAADESRRAALQQELAQVQQTSAGSAAERARAQRLEQQLAQRDAELAQQAVEIARVEEEARRYQARLAQLEARPVAAATPVADPELVIAAPSIQLIDPPAMTMRSPLTIKVRGAPSAREIVGKVTAPAGLLSFTVNDRNEEVDSNGLFKSRLALSLDATPVSMVAVDRRGKRAVLEFTLVAESAKVVAEVGHGPAAPALDYGRYHALVIGNQTYRHLPTLDTAVADATAVSEVLRKKYGFQVTTLTNATRYQILSALNELRGRLTEQDNLLIYYGGHGELDRANLRGHWLPVDAEPNSDANWISSVAITDILNAMSVKHALVVADSCYSGAMTRSSIGQLEAGLTDDARESWLKALVKARARTVLTSGGVQPVMDGGGGKHSVFAKSFLEVLWANEGVLEAQRLYREVAARVVFVAARFKVEQRPEYAPMKFAGHESGDFIFVPSGS